MLTDVGSGSGANVFRAERHSRFFVNRVAVPTFIFNSTMEAIKSTTLQSPDIYMFMLSLEMDVSQKQCGINELNNGKIYLEYYESGNATLFLNKKKQPSP